MPNAQRRCFPENCFYSLEESVLLLCNRNGFSLRLDFFYMYIRPVREASTWRVKDEFFLFRPRPAAAALEEVLRTIKEFPTVGFLE